MSEACDTEDASSNHVGPIIFANEIARGQLVTHGEVVTFRESRRTTGDTWWRKTRTGTKEGDVHVEEIRGPIDPWGHNVLEPYANLSGFDSAKDWLSAIYGLNGETTEGYLYRVEVRDDE